MQETKPEARLTPKSIEDLESIFQYTADRWGLDKADNYTAKLKNGFQTLAENPYSGYDCSILRPDLRCAHIGHHIAFYRPASYGVAIIRVLHERMYARSHL
ncbi:MAG: hypothetical protein DHS20C11_05270 [Lysobacteraceae bacterium]|nr:MAG: hypothetical protein DHS20C11_05270 [Xanthomonadaceae bacterium]